MAQTLTAQDRIAMLLGRNIIDAEIARDTIAEQAAAIDRLTKAVAESAQAKPVDPPA